MKLAAIYNVFDGVELLEGSMQCLGTNVDLIIVVYQDISNSGEKFKPMDHFFFGNIKPKIIFQKYIPDLSKSSGWNEREKRNKGVEIAKNNQCSHFLHIDCDEYYQDFAAAKKEYLESGKNGSVCYMFTYFKLPTLRLEEVDNYFVPFIHELHQKTYSGSPNYPFYVDPTRTVNTESVAQLSAKMHHFSWCRKDIGMKVRNSSAKVNIDRSDLLKNYNDPELKAGFFLKDYNQKLINVPDIFNLSKILK